MTTASSHGRPLGRAAASPTYHHGALRNALLVAAESLLLENGVAGFTLRACARRAGVSHAAPAHHFGDTRGLLTAFAAIGFHRMADLMEQHRAVAKGGASARLVAVGFAYISFAQSHRAHFQLMFSGDLLDCDDAELRLAAKRSQDLLETALCEAVRDRNLPPADIARRGLLAWSAVHGFATLLVEGQLDGPFGLNLENTERVNAATSQMLTLLSPALVGSDAS